MELRAVTAKNIRSATLLACALINYRKSFCESH